MILLHPITYFLSSYKSKFRVQIIQKLSWTTLVFSFNYDITMVPCTTTIGYRIYNMSINFIITMLQLI